MTPALKFDNGPGMIGTWLKIPSLMTLEVISRSKFQFVVVDLEHSPVTLDWVHTVCAVAQANDTAVLVRLPNAGGQEVQRVLDLGVDGLVVPQIRTAAETLAIVSAATFAPRGRRGVGITSRAGAWGLAPRDEYMSHGDHQVVRCIQIETVEAFDNLDAILDVPGVNAVLLGPADLAAALALPPTDPTLSALTVRLLEATAARGIACGTAVANPDQAKAAAAAGFRFIVVGNDATVFAEGMSLLADLSAQALGQRGDAHSGRDLP